MAPKEGWAPAEFEAEVRREIEKDEPDWDRIRQLRGLFATLNISHTDASSRVTTLHKAAYDGQPEICTWALQSRADPNATSNVGRTPLHMAADGNQPRSIRMLVEARGDVNRVTLSGLTPLHIACKACAVEAVEALLGQSDQLIDVDAEDEHRLTAEALVPAKDRGGAVREAIARYRRNRANFFKREMLRKELRPVFDYLDKHKYGYIGQQDFAKCQHELVVIAQSMGRGEISEEGVAKAYADADLDKDGKVDYAEFENAHEALLNVLRFQGEQAQDAIRRLHKKLAEPPRSVAALFKLSEKLGDDKSEAADAFTREMAAVMVPEELAASLRTGKVWQERLAALELRHAPRQSFLVCGPGMAAGVKVKYANNNNFVDELMDAIVTAAGTQEAAGEGK